MRRGQVLSKFTIRICNLAIHVDSADARLIARARERYAPFQTRGPADLSLQISLVDRPLRPELDEPRVWRKGRAVHVERHDLELSLEAGIGHATMIRGARTLDSLLRIALSLELLKRGGFLCHSAAVDGWLFPGISGAGKSTLGRSVPKNRLLADELVGVVGGQLWGTPFRGDFLRGKNPACHPLEAIFLLERHGPRGVRPIPKVHALMRLLQCALHFSDDLDSGRTLLKLAHRCVQKARTFALGYDAQRTTYAGVERQIREALR
jgi:hypothetical protein